MSLSLRRQHLDIDSETNLFWRERIRLSHPTCLIIRRPEVQRAGRQAGIDTSHESKTYLLALPALGHFARNHRFWQKQPNKFRACPEFISGMTIAAISSVNCDIRTHSMYYQLNALGKSTFFNNSVDNFKALS